MRKPHKLRANKKTTTPVNIIFFDVETSNVKISDTEDKPILKIGWACFVRKKDNTHNYKPIWLKFTEAFEFWDFIERYCREKTKVYLVAHNIGFDFRVLGGFTHAKRQGWQLKSFFAKGLTTLMRFTYRGCTIQLIDNTNFFPMALEKLGKVLGFPKLDVDFDNVGDNELSLYCKRDVEIMKLAWEKWVDFIQEHDLGNFKPTLPSTAFNSFRHRFMTHDIWIHDDKEVTQLERESFHGGRTECFYVGHFNTKRFYQVDVNSMYAHLMHTENYPTQLMGKRESISVAGLAHKLTHYAVIAKVGLLTDIPLFPIILNGRLIYPTGNFETVLSSPELKYALDRGIVQEVKQLAWYRQEKIFKEYCEFFHTLKVIYEQDGNTAFRALCKLFNNSLYGKFGQHGLKQTVIGSTDDNSVDRIRVYNVDTGKESVIFHLAGKVIEYTKEGESYNSFPAIPSHVTAYGRIYLWQLFNAAGRENVLYSDTDGFICTEEGYRNVAHLLHPTQMGKLKLEHTGDFVDIRAPKDYTLGDKVVHKGIRKNAVQLRPNVFEQSQFMGLRGMIRSGIPDHITIKRQIKTLHRNIYSGIVEASGKVTPFHLV